MNEALIGGIVLLLIVGLYFGSYIMNKNTEAPEGAIVVDKCSTCGTSGACSLSKQEQVSLSDDQVCEDFQE